MVLALLHARMVANVQSKPQVNAKTVITHVQTQTETVSLVVIVNTGNQLLRA